jgi:hypothetical protein
MTGPAPRHEKFVEVPGAVHWLFINWPTQKEDAAALKNHMIYYNRWLEDGFTWIQHFPMGEGKMLIEFRRPAGSKGG